MIVIEYGLKLSSGLQSLVMRRGATFLDAVGTKDGISIVVLEDPARKEFVERRFEVVESDQETPHRYQHLRSLSLSGDFPADVLHVFSDPEEYVIPREEGLCQNVRKAISLGAWMTPRSVILGHLEECMGCGIWIQGLLKRVGETVGELGRQSKTQA